MTLLSILLPFRNAADTLAAAVESLLAQTMEDWELWLLNDGSTDESPQMAEGYAKQEGRIRSASLAPQGLVAALNHGIDHSNAPLIARMDADDVCHPERLARQVAFLKEHPEVDLVSCRVAFGGDATAQAGYAAHVDWLNTLLTPEDHGLHRFVDAPVAHPSVLFRRSAVVRFGAYRDGPFPEDFEMWLRWMEQGARLAKVPETLLTWMDSPGRLSRTDDRYAQDALYEVKCQYLKQVLPPQRPIWLWGAGRITRKRFSTLDQVMPFSGFIDIDPQKIGNRLEGRPVVAPEEIPRDAFVLLGVSNPGARELSTRFLEEHGRVAGDDFLPVA